MRFSSVFGAASILAMLSACQSAPQAEIDVDKSALEIRPLSAKEQLVQGVNKYHTENVPAEAQTQFNLALKYKSAGELQRAKQLFSNMLVQYPDLSGIHLQLAYIAKSESRQAQYVTHLEHALEVNPYNYYAANELALVRRRTGQFKQALMLYQQAIDSWSGFATSYINKGILLDLYLDDKEAALAAYQTYLLLISPEHAKYRQVSTWIVDLEHQIKRKQQGENNG